MQQKMEAISIRKLTLSNLEILFPVATCIALGVYLHGITDFYLIFIFIGFIGFLYAARLFLTTITISDNGVTRTFLRKKRIINHDEIGTLEIFSLGRFGATKLKKEETFAPTMVTKSNKIILVSITPNKRPSPWWKTDTHTISIPFRADIFNTLNSRARK